MSAIILVSVVLSAICLAAFLLRSKEHVDMGVSYQSAGALFSIPERSFLSVLDQAVGAEYRVFGKVRIADLGTIKAGLQRDPRQGAANRIASKHIDFVVCRVTDMAIVCAVEFEAKSHASYRDLDRHELIQDVCSTIGLPLMRIAANRSYSSQELRAQFLAVTSPTYNRTVVAS